MTIEQRVYDGNRAKEVLDNEVFQQVMNDLKTEITTQWQNSPARDNEGREKLWMLLSLANKLETMLKASLDSGKLATLELEHRKSLAERLKGSLGMASRE